VLEFMMKRLNFSVFAIAAMSCVAIGNAQAFTYDGRASLNMDTSLRYQDPEEKLQNNLTNSQPGSNSSSGRFGNFSFKFSGANSGPNGAQSPFLPSANSSFASPFGPNNIDLALGGRH
jgi:hypothetical protein